MGECALRYGALREWSDDPLLHVPAEIFASLDEPVHRCQLLGLQLEVDDPLVPNFKGPEVLGDKVNTGPLIPRGANRMKLRLRLVAVLDEMNLARPVVSERGRNGCRANLLVIDKCKCPGRGTADGQSTADATCVPERDDQ